MDFAPKALVPDALSDKSITISSEEFCHYLDRRERSAEMRAAKRGIVDDLPPGLINPPSPASSASDTPGDDNEHRLEAGATAHEEKSDRD